MIAHQYIRDAKDYSGCCRLQMCFENCSRGCAFGDFDNDGDIDILIVNLNEPPSLLRNDMCGYTHWLKVKLIGTQSNRSAIWSAGGGPLWWEETGAAVAEPEQFLLGK